MTREEDAGFYMQVREGTSEQEQLNSLPRENCTGTRRVGAKALGDITVRGRTGRPL